MTAALMRAPLRDSQDVSRSKTQRRFAEQASSNPGQKNRALFPG